MLKISTVRKELMQNLDMVEICGNLCFNPSNPGPRFFINNLTEGGLITVEDARWSEKLNVHIVSYFVWPKNKEELNKTCSEIKQIYSTLCGARFPE